MAADERRDAPAAANNRPGFWSYVVVLLACTPLILHLSGVALR